VTDSAAAAPAIELVGIRKSFGRVAANRGVDLAVAPGSIHGLVGENGAGKSTLMNILYGVYQPDGGEIRRNGAPVRIASTRHAIAQGIGMVHQHFMLAEPLTVLENVMLGAEGAAWLGTARTRARTRLAHLAAEYGLALALDRPVASLTLGEKQRAEILRALYREADLLILDLNLPLQDGWDILGQVNSGYPLLPVVVITGLADQLDERTIPGASAFLEKPIEVPALLQIVERLLNRPPEERLAESRSHFDSWQPPSTRFGSESHTKHVAQSLKPFNTIK